MDYISIEKITNDTQSGIFDELMKAVDYHINEQYTNNRITGSDYANVYLGSIQAVLQQSMQYTLQEPLLEAQVEGIIADNLLKAKQLEIAEQELAIRQYELNNTLPAQLAQTLAQTAEITDSTLRANTELDDQLLSTANDRDVKTRGIVEQELTGAKERILLDTQEEIEQYKVDNLLPAELTSLNKDIEVKERSMVEQEATGLKQRLILDKDIALKEYENTVLQLDQHTTNIAQQTLLATEEEAKQYEVDNLMPAQLAQTQKQTEVAERQRQNLYTEQVLKDKEAAKLGLDNVMKTSEAARNTNPSFVYTPKYTEGI